MGRVGAEQRAAAVARLEALRVTGGLTTAHVRLAATGLHVAERTVWRWLGPDTAGIQVRPGAKAYRLSATDREAYAHFRGNVAAVYRARAAVTAGAGTAAGLPVPDFLVTGWAGGAPVPLRTLQKAFARELTPAERAGWREGEHARRAAQVYLTRPAAARNRAWEADHKDLPILVLPPAGRRCGRG